MDRPSTSEHTPLVRPPKIPSYVFSSVAARQRRNRLHKVQCCLCTCLIIIFTLALFITISYNIESIDEANDDASRNTNDTSENITMITLLALSWPRTDVKMDKWAGTVLDNDLKQSGEAGEKALAQRTKFEETAKSLVPGSPAFRAQLAMGATPPSLIMSRSGYAKDYATKYFLENYRTPKTNWCIGNGPAINATWTLPNCLQDQNITCTKTKYRTINGTCNNIEHPLSWGVAFTPFRRILPPVYSDGIMQPRVAHNKGSLPSARQISLQVHRPIYRADPQFTVVLAVWGQFLDHDITATALNKGVNNSAISCCADYTTPGRIPHPECYPVKLAPGDSNYDWYNISCMEFVRSAPAPSCNLGPREQLNQATAFIDGSTVYGPYNDLALKLRSFVDGELVMMTTPDGRELLPVSHDPDDGCNEAKMNKKGKYCFLSGDIRANENLHLTTMHLLWSRQHNLIARRLHTLNPHWDDEKLFQESKRIIGAQMQHITYNEFLPVLLGPELMEKMELSPQTQGYYENYNASMNPSVANSFASSVFRFAHTLLPTLMKVANSHTDSPEYVHLHKMLFNPYSLYNKGGVDDAMSGAMQTGMQKVDPYFTPELTSHLFERDEPLEQATAGSKPISPCGLDLVSLNIQRGRDHGLPPYPMWREHCGFKRPMSFSDLKNVVDPDSLYRISTIYKDINDLDLYTGALSEIPMKGSVLGPTITCLISDQFIRLKRGDRYWYETSEKPQAFTADQLNEIRKTKLAGIICQNGDSLEEAQLYVMRNPGSDNPLIKCSQYQEIDLSMWYEAPMTARVSLTSGMGVRAFAVKGNP